MVEKAESFTRKDGVSGHIVHVNGQQRVFVELGRDFSFGGDSADLYSKYLRDESSRPPRAREIKIPRRKPRK